MASDRLSIRLPEQLQQNLADISARTGRSESQLVREALAEFFARHARQPTCYDLAAEAGLIGCIDSGVGDLSTNTDHMEGFGGG
ncbi:MAG: ribbon-helix-helix domain-containing protein [Planctomycetaceae bacterium]|nr:ribbon-helix-helix domain-containing protein [Planctomycetaceae bacterium]